MLIGQLALISGATFAGAALYVSVAEQPARLLLDDRALLTEWKPSYKHGAAMQAPLALIGAVLGGIAWWRSEDWVWLAGAIVLIAGWPYTLLVIRPTNDALLAADPVHAGPSERRLVELWGRLHALRTTTGVVSTILFLLASLRTPT